jgi:hypothetical protein
MLVFVSAVYASEQTDRQIGIIYIKNATAKYILGEYESSVGLLRKAEEFYSTSSDYSYLSGLIFLERDNDINTAAEHFTHALSADDWLLLDSRECVSDLAHILFRKKEYSELLNLIANSYAPDYGENDLMYLYLLSLKNTGENELYRNNLWKSIRRYSDDYRFASLLLHESEVYKKEILGWSHVFKNQEGGLKVFLEAVLTMADSPGKIGKLEEYFNDGGKSLDAAVEYYRLTGTITEDNLKRLFADGVLENPALSRKLIGILPTIDLETLYNEAAEVYTGNIFYDLNEDEYFEELYLYDNGVPAGISIDNNQDGVLERMIILEEGQPVELIITEDRFIRINFHNFPWVDEVSSVEGGKMNVYTFLTNSVALDFFKEQEGLKKPEIDDEKITDFITVLETQKSNAVKIASYTGGGSVDGLSFLKEEWERRDENSSILRIYNKLQGNYIYLNRDEERTAGFGDIDYDSLIDLKETYENGKLISIEADDNKNGFYDYKLNLEEDRSLSMWDYNEDGIYDCRQYVFDGIITTEFSTALDGVFDVIERN